VRRSVEVDVAVVESASAAERARRCFAVERRLADTDPLLDTALIGDVEAVVAGIESYAAAGATDLMLGLADFPSTGMLERLARALPR